MYSGRLSYTKWQGRGFVVFALVAIGMFWFVLVSLRKAKIEKRSEGKEIEIFKDRLKDWVTGKASEQFAA